MKTEELSGSERDTNLIAGTLVSTVATVGLISVNVGQPQVIGTTRFGHPIHSGIVKEPVTTGTLYLDALNLAGDRQADLSVHGGPDKAAYAYPSEHLPTWNDELGTTFGIGTFGENLTTVGWLEDGVLIGDVWQWGDALLQVSQPRSPCYKLATVTGRPDLLKRFVRHGRTGWYLRVLRPGVVPVAGPIAVIERGNGGISVWDAHRLLMVDGDDRKALERLSALDALALSWREAAREQLAAI